MHNYHRVWAEVNLDAIRANMESFRDNVPKEAMLDNNISKDLSIPDKVWEVLLYIKLEPLQQK